MDFLLLIYSLSFLMLGAVSLGLSRLTGTVRLWQCLAFFGIAQGLYGIAEMLLECFNGADFIHWTHCAFTALSCFGLVQFGMPLGQKIGTHIISWSTYFPLVALAALGLIQGVEGLEYSLPFGFILPGGVAAAWRFRQLAFEYKTEGNLIRGASAAMLVFAIFHGLLAPLSILLPVSVEFRQQWMVSSCWPMRILAIVCMSFIGLKLWLFYWKFWSKRFPRPALSLAFWLRDPFLAIVLSIILLCGWAGSEMISSREIESNILQLNTQTRLAASFVDLEKVKQLNWSNDDLGTPYYEALKQMMMHIHSNVTSCRFVCLMGVSDDHCYVLVDSESTNSPDYSPPGQLYEEADPAFVKMLQDHKPFIEGPSTDRWGTFVTGGYPLLDLSESGGPLRKVSFTIDIPIRHVQQTVALARLPMLVITMLCWFLAVGLHSAWKRTRVISAVQSLELDRIRRQENTIARLARSETIGAGDFKAAVQEITHLAAESLLVERMSVWVGEFRNGAIQCIDLYELSQKKHSQLPQMDARQCPAFFSTIVSGWTINASDVLVESSLAELVEPYFKPAGIASVLDAPVYMDGHVVGMVCFEHVGSKRVWMEDEFRFAGEIADEVAYALVSERRKQSDLALIASEQRFREFVDFLPQVVFETDLKGNFTLVNKVAYDLTGYTPADVENTLSVFHICDPSQHDLLRANLVKLSRVGKSLGHEYIMRRKDGSSFYALVYATCNNHNGKPIGFRGIAIDISDRKKMEEALRESERRLTSIIDFLPDATLIVNKEGKVVYWNRAIEKMTGVPAKDMLGKGHREYALPFYGERRPILIDLVFEIENNIEKKYIGITREGDNIIGEAFIPCLGERGSYLWGVASPLRDRDGLVIGAIESIRDVSARRRAEDALRDTHVELGRSYESLKKLLMQQEVNIDLAKQIMALVNAEPQRHIALANELSLFISSLYISRHAAGGDHYFARTIHRADSKSSSTVISLKDQSGHEVGCILRSIVTDLIHNALLHEKNRSSLEGIISELNDRICASNLFKEDDFFTSINVEIEHDSLLMRFVSTGHPPFFIVRGNKVLKMPDDQAPGTNMPVGLIGRREFSAGQFRLQPGDKIILYTDGLLELPRRHSRPTITSIGLQEVLEQIVDANPSLSVTALVNEMLRTLSPPLAVEQADDFTDDVAVLGLEIEKYLEAFQDVLYPKSDDDLTDLTKELYLKIEKEWKSFGIDNPEHRLRLVLEEALLNAWKHGNQRNSEKGITVSRRYGNDAIIEVTNEGRGFDFETIYDPTSHDNLTKPSGRGLFIIRLISSSVHWKNEGRTIVACFQGKPAYWSSKGRATKIYTLDLWGNEQ